MNIFTPWLLCKFNANGKPFCYGYVNHVFITRQNICKYNASFIHSIHNFINYFLRCLHFSWRSFENYYSWTLLTDQNSFQFYYWLLLYYFIECCKVSWVIHKIRWYDLDRIPCFYQLPNLCHLASNTCKLSLSLAYVVLPLFLLKWSLAKRQFSETPILVCHLADFFFFGGAIRNCCTRDLSHFRV